MAYRTFPPKGHWLWKVIFAIPVSFIVAGLLARSVVVVILGGVLLISMYVGYEGG